MADICVAWPNAIAADLRDVSGSLPLTEEEDKEEKEVVPQGGVESCTQTILCFVFESTGRSWNAKQ